MHAFNAINTNMHILYTVYYKICSTAISRFLLLSLTDSRGNNKTTCCKSKLEKSQELNIYPHFNVQCLLCGKEDTYCPLLFGGDRHGLWKLIHIHRRTHTYSHTLTLASFSSSCFAHRCWLLHFDYLQNNTNKPDSSSVQVYRILCPSYHLPGGDHMFESKSTPISHIPRHKTRQKRNTGVIKMSRLSRNVEEVCGGIWGFILLSYFIQTVQSCNKSSLHCTICPVEPSWVDCINTIM